MKAKKRCTSNEKENMNESQLIIDRNQLFNSIENGILSTTELQSDDFIMQSKENGERDILLEIRPQSAVPKTSSESTMYFVTDDSCLQSSNNQQCKVTKIKKHQ